MFCTSCGKKIPDGMGFCPYCGAAQKPGGQPSPSPASGPAPAPSPSPAPSSGPATAKSRCATSAGPKGTPIGTPAPASTATASGTAATTGTTTALVPNVDDKRLGQVACVLSAVVVVLELVGLHEVCKVIGFVAALWLLVNIIKNK